jgi:hypothetical protein
VSQSSTTANIKIGPDVHRAKEIITTEHSEWDPEAKVWKPTHRTEETREYDVVEPAERVVYHPYFVQNPPAQPGIPIPVSPQPWQPANPWAPANPGPVWAGDNQGLLREANTAPSNIPGQG